MAFGDHRGEWCTASPIPAEKGRASVYAFDMSSKRFRLAADQITALAVGYGSCFATDRIVVDGAPVGYCYRESPDSPLDSGWRFFAGDESDSYVDDPTNVGLYDVNTIANYDSAVLPILDSPYDSAFERNRSGQLVPVPFEPPF